MRIASRVIGLLSLAIATPSTAADQYRHIVEFVDGIFTPSSNQSTFSWSQSWNSVHDSGNYLVSISLSHSATINAQLYWRTAIPLMYGWDDQNNFNTLFYGVGEEYVFPQITVPGRYLNAYGEVYNVRAPILFVSFDENMRGMPVQYRISIIGDVRVPEPATWAMLIAGFGLSGAALRRRRYAGSTVKLIATSSC